MRTKLEMFKALLKHLESAKDKISRELEILRMLQADHTRYLTKEEFERLNYLAVYKDKATAELYAESLRKEVAELDEQLQLYHTQITDLKAEIERLKSHKDDEL